VITNRLKVVIVLAYWTSWAPLLLGAAGCGKHKTSDEPEAAPPAMRKTTRPLTDVVFERTPARLDRGKYLAEGLLQCFICHTDRDWNQPGAPPLVGKKGSGHVFRDDGEYRLVAPNITPDPETGAGTWTDDMFARAIREGISHDGRGLHPQMWYDSFRNLSDEDLASVIVYIRSIPAVHNLLKTTKEKKERAPMSEAITNAVPEPDSTYAVTRGRYLVRIADCIGCHTAFEAPLNPGFFAGGNLIELEKEKAFSSNITPDPSGISYYDDAFFIQVLRTGHVKARKLSPVMPWTVFRNLTDEDLKSIFAYLRSRRPVHHTIDKAELPTECPMCGQKHGFGDRNHPKIEAVVKVDSSAYSAYVGRYRFEDGFTLIVLTDGGRLLLQLEGDQMKIELVPISETEFTAKEIPDVISFVRDENGRVTHLLSNVDDVGTKLK